MSPKRFDDTREHLLQTGQAVMLGKGFAAVGLAEILACAQVPKGSFYHYFSSKEHYGIAMLERYFANYAALLEGVIAEPGLNGCQKLEIYFSGWYTADALEQHKGDNHCLAVKLAAEVTDLSDAMRATLQTGIQTIIGCIGQIISLGRQDGSLPVGADANEVAAMLYQVWVGAALVTKVNRNQHAVDIARRTSRALLGLAPG